jgi:hypothetical protein
MTEEEQFQFLADMTEEEQFHLKVELLTKDRDEALQIQQQRINGTKRYKIYY